MKTIRLLSAALVGITTLVVVVGLVRSNRWSVRQEIDIAAPASLIRPRVDLHRLFDHLRYLPCFDVIEVS